VEYLSEEGEADVDSMRLREPSSRLWWRRRLAKEPEQKAAEAEWMRMKGKITVVKVTKIGLTEGVGKVEMVIEVEVAVEE
jgi:hypothetical protein